MELINIYEYIEYIVRQKEEDLPYSKIDMIYIYNEFLHTSVTPDNKSIQNWKINDFDVDLLIKELVDTSTEINIEYYNKFSKQVLREKVKNDTREYLIEEGIPEENILINMKPFEYNPIEHEDFEYPNVELHLPSNNSISIEYVRNKYGIHLQWDDNNECKSELYDIHSGVIELPLSLEEVLDLYEMSILDVNPFARNRYNESMGETVNRLLKSYKRMK